ncbi:hypothetical protein FNV43_RR11265 [Rhamnella rubrinervis]|uniref:SHSP domain-containing protein n=1 Tax=Rhamnella rubrinervis TaxID=2594499 RepID=A0A8K0H583_9ROSA|nr:hypothetical protein FNV43_RR11265 [Rhamnella rubrinervis]
MDVRGLTVDPLLLMDTIHDLLELSDEPSQTHHPSRAYVRDNKAMAATPADVMDDPNAYIFIIDMPGLKSDQIKVLVEDNTLINANLDNITAVSQDGVLTVTVEKKPPPEPKKPKTVQVQVAKKYHKEYMLLATLRFACVVYCRW